MRPVKWSAPHGGQQSEYSEDLQRRVREAVGAAIAAGAELDAVAQAQQAGARAVSWAAIFCAVWNAPRSGGARSRASMRT